MSPRMLQATTIYNLVCVGLAAIGSLILWPDGAFGVLIGGILMAANFWVLRTMMLKILSGAENRAKMIYALLLAGKFIFVMGAMAILVLVLDVNPVGLAIGMATLFCGIGLGIVHSVIRPDLSSPQQNT